MGELDWYYGNRSSWVQRQLQTADGMLRWEQETHVLGRPRVRRCSLNGLPIEAAELHHRVAAWDAEHRSAAG